MEYSFDKFFEENLGYGENNEVDQIRFKFPGKFWSNDLLLNCNNFRFLYKNILFVWVSNSEVDY